MDEALKQDIQNAIEHSGFPLEHDCYGILRKHEWSIITNRFYIDDIRRIEREVDIVAYKVHVDELEKILYITSLIISCKRSESKTWCFLTRKADESDDNIDWTPLHYCTTDKRLEYMTNSHRENVIHRYKANNATRELYHFNENVFAYEQLREASNTNERSQKGNIIICGNDDIYNSIITSIKAVEYEKRSRTEQHKQRKYKRYYTFHILSVFDGKMVKDYIDNESNHNIENIQEIKYLNRHIINNKDNFYIVNFVNKTNFENIIQLFNKLHSENTRTLPKLITSFYNKIFEEDGKVQFFWKEFSESIKFQVKKILLDNKVIKSSDEIILLYKYIKKEHTLHIGFDLPILIDNKTVLQLNEDITLREQVKSNLKKLFRYEGNVVFTDEFLFLTKMG